MRITYFEKKADVPIFNGINTTEHEALWSKWLLNVLLSKIDFNKVRYLKSVYIGIYIFLIFILYLGRFFQSVLHIII